MSVIISAPPDNPAVYHVWAFGSDGFYRLSRSLPYLTARMFEQYHDFDPVLDSAIARFRRDVEKRDLVRLMDMSDESHRRIIENCGLLVHY